MHQDIVSRLELDAELRRALDRGELTVHYQPVVHIADRTITGFEALVRWQHPERGLILPELFIKFADDTGLIDAIGRFVIGSACRQVRAWQKAHPRRQSLSVGVNLSARQINDPGIVATISRALAETGLPPSSLVIEFTESTVMQDSAATLERLFELKQLGVRLAIDDFGTGYSALSYLRRFPVDIIKIDRSFVEHVADRTDAMAVTRAIIDLAKSLRLRAVAEGVEHPEQAAELLALGCDYAQGYLFGRPLEPAQAGALLAQPAQRPRPAQSGAVPAAATSRSV